MNASFPAGFKVGHWTSGDKVTGCTVILPPRGNVTAVDVRGSSPSTREVEHLRSHRKITETHGILLTGSSAYGLAAADGVVAWLEERGIGYATPIGVVPIVPAAVIFDAGVAHPESRPTRDAGYSACEAAHEGDVEKGTVGAGTGATVGKWAGREHAVPGGLGIGRAREGGHEVAAIAVANAVGDVLADDTSVVAGTSNPQPRHIPFPRPDDAASEMQNTVLVCLATVATLPKPEVAFLAERGSDGVTVSVRPAHTRYDGDVVFAVAVPQEDPSLPVDLDLLGHLATRAVAAAVRDAVTP